MPTARNATATATDASIRNAAMAATLPRAYKAPSVQKVIENLRRSRLILDGRVDDGLARVSLALRYRNDDPNCGYDAAGDAALEAVGAAFASAGYRFLDGLIDAEGDDGATVECWIFRPTR